MGRPAESLPLARQENFKAALGTEKEVAVFLNCKEVTLRTWRRTGAGPKFIKANRLVRYRWDDVAAWLAQREAASTSTPIAANQ